MTQQPEREAMLFKFIRHMTIFIVITIIALGTTMVAAQDEATPEPEPLNADEMEETFLSVFNTKLTTTHDHPALTRNDILDEVAQDIAEKVGCTDERVDFSIQTEVRDLGFAMYPQDNLPRTTRIPLVTAVNLAAIDAVADLYVDGIYGTNIARQGLFYREIGIGVSPCVAVEGGNPQYGLFVILGAQPDVIPVVIGDGTSQQTIDNADANVTISVHDESSRRVEGIFGEGATMRLSDEPLTDDVRAVPYRSITDFSFGTCGEITLFYELTDTLGVVSEGETSTELICEEE